MQMPLLVPTGFAEDCYSLPATGKGVEPGEAFAVPSPFLFPARTVAVCSELKFVISSAMGQAVKFWAIEHLSLDPHAEFDLGNAYRVQSLYLDTPFLNIYRGTPDTGGTKFRLRRYGDGAKVYLECKTKSGDRVEKNRTCIDASQLHQLRKEEIDSEWNGCWFHESLETRQLRPTCLIAYDRTAYVGADSQGPLRLTLDTSIAASRARDWIIANPLAGSTLFPGQIILELKYRAALPALFKRLIQEFNLDPQSCSKYRAGVATWAESGPRKEVG
jgi:hypothetical protein